MNSLNFFIGFTYFSLFLERTALSRVMALSRPSVSVGGARRRQIWSDAAMTAAIVRILLRPSARYAIALQAVERSRDLCVERGTGLSLIGGPLYWREHIFEL